MYRIGRLCVKIAGRDAGKKCIIIDALDKNYVLIDGETRRRKCNVKHLEPTSQVLKVTKKAPRTEIIRVFKTLNIDIKESKPKKKVEKPVKTRKKKEKPMKKGLVKKEKVTKPVKALIKETKIKPEPAKTLKPLVKEEEKKV